MWELKKLPHIFLWLLTKDLFLVIIIGNRGDIVYKKVGFAYYVHKSNLNELFFLCGIEDREHIIRVIDLAKMYLLLDFEIVKFDIKTKNVSLIQCSTWNTLNEPIVEDSYCFHPDFSYKIVKGGTKVYHNKWQFVAENYDGFDIECAKERTKLWNSIPNIKDYKSKIGNKDFWYSLLQQYNLDV